MTYKERADITKAIGGVLDALGQVLALVTKMGEFWHAQKWWSNGTTALDAQIVRSLGVDALRACEAKGTQ